jgi:hypothetical protein
MILRLTKVPVYFCGEVVDASSPLPLGLDHSLFDQSFQDSASIRSWPLDDGRTFLRSHPSIMEKMIQDNQLLDWEFT